MFDLSIPDPDGNLYLVTDSHLDYESAPFGEFIDFLDSLSHVHTLVCLGDLFKLWLADQRYWTNLHKEVLSAFERLRKRSSQVILVAGNREFLLPKNINQLQKSRLPFSQLTLGKGYLTWGSKRFGFEHGDQINQYDINYLRWYALSHSKLFEAFFRSLPSSLANKIADNLETKMAQSNQDFKIHLPVDQLRKFAETSLKEVDEFFLGHFHERFEYCQPKSSKKLHIIPDWFSAREYWCIDPKGQRTELQFS
jgi:UDP-2,3-diacylglucosamine pyrophosphatase LpxH